MIVSGSQPTPCEHNVGDHLLTKFLKTKMDYARVKNMRVYYHMTRLDKEMTGLWAKLPLLRRLMVANPQVEWFWWMDADAAITGEHMFQHKVLREVDLPLPAGEVGETGTERF